MSTRLEKNPHCAAWSPGGAPRGASNAPGSVIYFTPLSAALTSSQQLEAGPKAQVSVLNLIADGAADAASKAARCSMV